MSFATVIAVTGLIFGMISIRLMSAIERAQVVIVKQIDESNNRVRYGRRHLRRRVTKKIVVFTISSQKLAFLKFGATIFARLSSIIFVAESMYPEKAVEGAAFAMMKTVMVSNRIATTVKKTSKHAVKKIRKGGS